MNVSVIDANHDRAMNLAEAAIHLRSNGDLTSATAKFREAFLLERDAADVTVDRKDYEPTRSVLHRSAASLALSCGDFSEAVRLAQRGLDGNPPTAIADELRDVLTRASK